MNDAQKEELRAMLAIGFILLLVAGAVYVMTDARGATPTSLVAVDSSGNSNDAGPVGNSQRSTGIINGTALLDGSTASYYTGYDSRFMATDNFSLSFWLKVDALPPSSGNRYTIAEQYQFQAAGTSQTRWQAFLRETGFFQWTTYVAGAARSTTTSAFVQPNVWYFVTLTYDGVNMNIYTNASQTATTINSGALDGATSGLFLGSDGVNRRFCACYLDEFRWYSKVLSTSEMSNVMNGTLTGNDTRTNLGLWYRFDEIANASAPTVLVYSNSTVYANGTAYANVTNYANSTAYANTTLNPLLNATVYANATTNVTANVTVNTTLSDANLTVNGPVQITTAVDNYVPLLVWGGLVLWFGWTRAFPSMFAALLALEIHVWGVFPPTARIAMSVMLVGLTHILYMLAVNRWIPAPWHKKD